MSILASPRIWAAVIGFAAVQPALAAMSPTVFPQNRAERHVLPPQAGSEKIISTFVHNGDANIAETAGVFTQIDSQSLTCPSSAGSCTFTVAADVEASGGANANNQWAVCTLVDGNYVDACPWTGELLADGNYGYGYSLQSVAVATGKHTVTVQVYSLDGLNAGYYQIQYSAYKP